MSTELRLIGFVRGGRVEAIDDAWDGETCRIELGPDRFDPSCLVGLGDSATQRSCTGFTRSREISEG